MRLKALVVKGDLNIKDKHKLSIGKLALSLFVFQSVDNVKIPGKGYEISK